MDATCLCRLPFPFNRFQEDAPDAWALRQLELGLHRRRGGEVGKRCLGSHFWGWLKAEALLAQGLDAVAKNRFEWGSAVMCKDYRTTGSTWF